MIGRRLLVAFQVGVEWYERWRAAFCAFCRALLRFDKCLRVLQRRKAAVSFRCRTIS